MRYMAIDFGAKRVGVALSDESGKFALPFKVLPNDKNLLAEVGRVISDQGIVKVVFGESKNYKGEENPIFKKAKTFAEKLEKTSTVVVYWEDEFLTSAEAARLQGEHDMSDASAAALILKSFLDKNRGSSIVSEISSDTI